VQISSDAFVVAPYVTHVFLAVNAIAMLACAALMWSTASDMRQALKETNEPGDTGCTIREGHQWSACFIGGRVYQMRNDNTVEVRK